MFKEHLVVRFDSIAFRFQYRKTRIRHIDNTRDIYSRRLNIRQLFRAREFLRGLILWLQKKKKIIEQVNPKSKHSKCFPLWMIRIEKTDLVNEVFELRRFE